MPTTELPTYRAAIYIVFDGVALGFILEGVPHIARGEWRAGCTQIGIAIAFVFVGIGIARQLGKIYDAVKTALTSKSSLITENAKLKAQVQAATMSTTTPGDLALLKNAPAHRVEYIGGTIGTLILKNDRDSPAIVRRFGHLESEEAYGSSYTLNVSPEVIPQIEKGNPMECRLYGVTSPSATSSSLEAVLRDGTEHSVDSVLIDYDDAAVINFLVCSC